MNLLITADMIDKFKCVYCKSPLSHFPIASTKHHRTVCGRCWIKRRQFGCYNKIFEELAQHIKFPCRYRDQGCNENLLPKDVPSHEKSCYFKSVDCPGKESLSCPWQGAATNILSHCRGSHNDLFLKSVFELDFKKKILFEKFLEHDGLLFVVNMELCKDSLEEDVGFRTLIYQIHQPRGQEETSLKTYSYTIALNRDNVNMFVRESVVTSFSDAKWGRIAFDSLVKNNPDQTSPLVVNIALFEENSEDDDPRPRKRFKPDLLSALKCSQCGVYVLPPIHQFEDNRIKCDRCSSASSGVGSSNFNLDRIAEKLYYPCRYEKNGCGVVAKSEEMKKHVFDCAFEDQCCPFCEWLGLIRDFKNHVLETHADRMVENGEEISAEISSGKICTIQYAGRLFMLKFYATLNDFKWIVAIIDRVETTFVFKIEISNANGNNRLLMRRKCAFLSRSRIKDNENDNTEDEETLCKIGKENEILQWRDLDKITFKIRISRQ